MTDPAAARILVVDDESHITDAVQRALERVGYAVDTAGDVADAWSKTEARTPDLILCDLRLGEASGLDLLTRVHEAYPEIPVVMITGHASIESAVAAMKAGAVDYLAKPFNPTQLRHAVAMTLDRKRLVVENQYLRAELRQLAGDGVVIGKSRAMQRLFEQARTVAATDSSVLITGKSGTGKEVLARFIHTSSRRKDRPFVTVNCAAIPPTLLESELFGHRRGAFTGATYSRRGSFELADGGTLFLDEIGEVPLDMQAKLLRAIEERQIKRVGSEESIRLDVRILAATNRNLSEETEAGRFRRDLYFRLNVVDFEVPPLAERPEDIEPLAHHFLALYARELKRPAREFSEEALGALLRHDWPGNVRELRNAVERALIFVENDTKIRLGHLPAALKTERAAAAPAPDLRAPGPKSYRTLREVEDEYIREVVAAHGGNRRKAAEVLGLSVVTLWRKLGKERGGEP